MAILINCYYTLVLVTRLFEILKGGALIACALRMHDSILYSRVRNLVTVESTEDQSILHKGCSPQQVYSLVDNSRQGYNHWIFIILIRNLSIKDDQQYIYETRWLGGHYGH
jgi:hypothetical protein